MTEKSGVSVSCLFCGHKFNPWIAEWANPDERVNPLLAGPGGPYITCPKCGKSTRYKVL